jgi:O-antigen/teichoic acid export membrane protein
VICVEAVFFCIIFGIIVRGTGFPIPNFSGLRSFLAFSVPQVPSGILLWIIASSDRYFITHFLDLSQTGVYSSSNVLGGVISLCFTPINYVLYPAVSKAWEQKRISEVKNYFEYSNKLFLTLAIPGAAGIAILSQPILTVLTTSQYLAGWELVLLVAIGTIFLGIYQNNAYIILLVKQTRWLPLMILVASATSLGVNFMLIPRIGILGAAISNIASYLVLAAIVSWWARKTINYHFDVKYLGKVIAATIMMSLCLYFLKTGGVWRIIAAIICGIIVFGIVLFVLRAFSRQDKILIKQTLGGRVPWRR